MYTGNVGATLKATSRLADNRTAQHHCMTYNCYYVYCALDMCFRLPWGYALLHAARVSGVAAARFDTLMIAMMQNGSRL
jgi:hypothetical protein